jgi:hypothetical protein
MEHGNQIDVFLDALYKKLQLETRCHGQAVILLSYYCLLGCIDTATSGVFSQRSDPAAPLDPRDGIPMRYR